MLHQKQPVDSGKAFEYTEHMINRINTQTKTQSAYFTQTTTAERFTQDTCLFKMLKCESKLVKFILEQNGLTSTDRHDWHILWTHTQGKTYFYERLSPHQKINHFPSSSELTRKDRLAVNVKKMQDKFGKNYVNFIPETYVIPDQHQ